MYLAAPIFTDEDAAREYLETTRWALTSRARIAVALIG